VEIEGEHNTSSIIPLLLSGGLPPEPGWAKLLRAYSQKSAHQFQWSLPDGLTVVVTASNADLSTSNFTDSLQWMTSPEDPNLSYTPGHQVPYPFAIIEIEGNGIYQVSFQILHE
jgi:hypothetical protein